MSRNQNQQIGHCHYLAATVLYAALYNKSLVELEYDAGLDEILAAQLRQAAWVTVQNYYVKADKES